MEYTKKEREQYNINRKRIYERLSITKYQYNWLRRKGETLHSLYEDYCNGDISEQNYDGETNDIYEVVDNYVASLGLFVYYQTDPRGATIYLDKEAIPEDNYTRACCIY